MGRIDPEGVMPTVHRTDAGGMIASHGNVMISVVWARVTPPFVDALRTHTAAMLARHGSFLSAVLVTGLNLRDAPDAPTRHSLSELIAETEDTGLGTAFIVTAEGFVASSIVAVVNGLFMVAGSNEPMRAFRGIEPAAQWLHAQAREGSYAWAEGELLAALQKTAEFGTSAVAAAG